MDCPKCGTELENNATTCPKCGASVEAEPAAQTGEVVKPETPRGFSNKRNILIIAIALVVLIIGGAVTAVAVTRGGTQSAESIMTLAERYLKEEKYEQAVIEFQRVIELDPMNVDAYLNLAKAYIGLGDNEKALEVLRDGLEKTGDSRLEDMIDELTKPAESSSVISSSSTASELVESEPEAVTSVTIQGVEYDVATTTSLNLSNTGTSNDDVKQIGKLTNLMYLFLSGNQISDITPLAGLTNLTNLTLSGNQISDITPLAGLTNLSKLGLDSNQISDITPLAGLSNLTNLTLWDNQISDIAPLAGLANLYSLSLNQNQISDITPLAGLTTLKYLSLNNNQISDITPLAGLTNLKTLSLGNNQISDITPLAGLTNLTELWLRNNQISDITPLVQLTKLTELHLLSTQVSDVDKAWLKEQLPDCSISA